MVFRLKDILNPKVNKANNQHSFDLRKRRLKEEGISMDDLLELKLTKKMLSR